MRVRKVLNIIYRVHYVVKVVLCEVLHLHIIVPACLNSCRHYCLFVLNVLLGLNGPNPDVLVKVQSDELDLVVSDTEAYHLCILNFDV